MQLFTILRVSDQLLWNHEAKHTGTKFGLSARAVFVHKFKWLFILTSKITCNDFVLQIEQDVVYRS